MKIRLKSDSGKTGTTAGFNAKGVEILVWWDDGEADSLNTELLEVRLLSTWKCLGRALQDNDVEVVRGFSLRPTALKPVNPGRCKQVILIRKDLHMSAGKSAAQAAHASVAALLKFNESKDNEVIKINKDEVLKNWLDDKFTKICLAVNSEQELKDIYERAVALGLPASLIKDAGYTELEGENYTTVSIGPSYNENFQGLTSHLELYD